MNIAITPRVGAHTRRSEQTLEAENSYLCLIPLNLKPVPLADTDLRDRLVAAKMIECASPRSRPSLWRLTDLGGKRVEALRGRRAAL